MDRKSIEYYNAKINRKIIEQKQQLILFNTFIDEEIERAESTLDTESLKNLLKYLENK